MGKRANPALASLVANYRRLGNAGGLCHSVDELHGVKQKERDSQSAP